MKANGIDAYAVVDDTELKCRKLVIKTDWRRAFERIFVEERCEALELNAALGFKGEEIEFVTSLDGLRHLVIIGDIDPAAATRCKDLESLTLDTPRARDFDFTGLAQLRKVFVYGIRERRSLLQLDKLRDLYVYGYEGTDLKLLQPLNRLEALAVAPASSLESLSGLEAFAGMRNLAVANAPLREITSVAGLAELEHLELNNCKGFASLEPLTSCTSLRQLWLIDCGTIESLTPLRNLRLEELLFYGDTNIVDGDLTPLSSMPLTNVAYKARKHYFE